ncbi:hypothetical protein QAD02_012269 [Eretmocerus hayati]|uniref:Uncharacterized protein n=1 Tax=Eretmocerus hayati TaxID=131215 RepID=A0ACC2P1Z0_9HYME|nr:hypothetical protein QAD02_012269 [Eretmocerus hayati]
MTTNITLVSYIDYDGVREESILQRAALILRRKLLAVEKKPLTEISAMTDLKRGECEIPKVIFDFYVTLAFESDAYQIESRALSVDDASSVSLAQEPSNSLSESLSDSSPSHLNTPEPKRRRTYEALTPELPHVRSKPQAIGTLLAANRPNRAITPSNLKRYRALDNSRVLSFIAELETPFWTGYMGKTLDDKLEKRIVTYLSTINHSPTTAPVIKELSLRAAEAADECQAPAAILHTDLGIYKPMMQLQSSEGKIEPAIENKVVCVLGSFHIKYNYHKCLGKLINGSCLTNILMDTGLMGIDSLGMFIGGKKYSKWKRLHWISCLALGMLHFQSFLDSHQITLPDEIRTSLQLFTKTKHAIPQIEDRRVLKLFDEYELYKQDTLNSVHGKTAQYFMLYCQMVEYTFMLERCIRLADIELILYILPKVIDVFIVFYHQNYARYVLWFHNVLMGIDQTHPGVKDHFLGGALGVKTGKRDSSTSDLDITGEQTACSQGISGMGGARHIWNSLGAKLRCTDGHSEIYDRILKEERGQF